MRPKHRGISFQVCGSLFSLLAGRDAINVGRASLRWKPIPKRWPVFTRRINGHVHAWKAGFAGRGWNHGCGGCIDAGHGHLYLVEDPGKRRALLPAPGRKQAVIAHDQHPARKTVFPTSHAGTRVSSDFNMIRRRMGAPELIFQGLWFDAWLDRASHA